MDLHKPKPWHGLREFLKEIGTIVIGVLIALGAEQAVEWLHWRHLAAEAEHDLAEGIKPDLVNAYNYLVIETCNRTRAAELFASLQKPGPDWHGEPLPLSSETRRSHTLPQVIALSGYAWPHEAWDAAVASGVLNHMPKDRVTRYADLYHLVEKTSAIQTPENLVASHLTLLAYDRKLTESEKANYLEMVAELASVTENFAVASRVMLQEAHAMGVDPSPNQVAAVFKRQRAGRGACVTDVKLPLS
jgi:hypothetical protein